MSVGNAFLVVRQPGASFCAHKRHPLVELAEVRVRKSVAARKQLILYAEVCSKLAAAEELQIAAVTKVFQTSQTFSVWRPYPAFVLFGPTSILFLLYTRLYYSSPWRIYYH